MYPNFLMSSVYLLLVVISFVMHWKRVIMMLMLLEFIALVLIFYALHLVSKVSIVFFLVGVLVMESIVGISLLVMLSRATSSTSSNSFVW